MKFKELLKRAYTPYSKKPNACIVIDELGGYHPGVDIENISYPLSISYIQNALFNCLSEGKRPVKIIYHSEPAFGDLKQYWETEYDIDAEINPNFEFELKIVLKQVASKNISSYLTSLCKMSITPNSSFPVSCLLDVDHGFVEGVNIECSNWELGLCAERVAVSKAIAYGYNEFKSIYIAAPKSDYVSPCGGCRQVMFEHFPNKPVYLFQNEHELLTLTTSDLLPYHFKGDLLKK